MTVPYGDSVHDEQGYGIQCPECPFIARGEGNSEDSITKSAGLAYALHYEGEHQA